MDVASAPVHASMRARQLAMKDSACERSDVSANTPPTVLVNSEHTLAGVPSGEVRMTIPELPRRSE